MDKQSDTVIEEGLGEKINRKSESTGGLSAYISRLRETENHRLIYDLIIFAIGFLLSRCHLAFGAHPLGLAFVCSLSTQIWPTLFGGVIGALSMGTGGIIFAAVTAIAVFLRAAISSGDKSCDGMRSLFQEPLLLRLSVSILCGFISAVYEMLLSDFSQESLIFGVTMILTAPVMTFIFSGLFLDGVKIKSLIFEQTDALIKEKEHREERYNHILFCISALMLVFFIGLSFKGVSILGISLSYVFSSIITLLVAKRFGGIYGMAVGFVSSLSISGSLSVAFALAGLGSGMLFGVGTSYAIVAGGIAICAWSIYSSGLSGLLSTFPEYIISAVAGLPLFKAVKDGKKEEEAEDPREDALDMIGTMALAYQSKYSGNVDRIKDLLLNMSKTVKNFSEQEEPLSIEDYRKIVIGIAECHCIGCNGAGFCSSEDVRPCIKNADKIASMLYLGKRIQGKDVNTNTEFCQMADPIAESINREAGQAFLENQKRISLGSLGEDYKLISKLVESAITQDANERRIDNTLTPALTEATAECGIDQGAARVFGKRRKHFLIAAKDSKGEKITSAQLTRTIESKIGVRLGKPEYFKRGDMALMECSIKPKLCIEWAVASKSGHEEEVSGDSYLAFATSEDMFYGLISDGMGSGRSAKETSEFVGDMIHTAMECGADKETVIHLLNRTIKSRKEECSATVDLFETDLLNGEAMFIKSGAAPSYVKRDSSIFRIRSQTAPIGLMASIDTEKTKITIKSGDHIIMLSDGIADEGDEAAWLLLLLGDPARENLQEYADLILSEAVIHNRVQDDMTVLVLRVFDAE